MIGNSTLEWAQQTFSHAKLGDSRRTQQLVQLASDMASNIGVSIVQACPNPASVEGAYRLIRNPDVEANAIAEAGFSATASVAREHGLLLALEDSTALTYTHKSLSELTPAGQRTIHIAQRGGRKARKATLDVRFAPITIKVPANKCGKSLSLYYVGCKEQGDRNEKLEWHLLTSEPVTTTAQAQEIISYYEQRWLVEEFRKAWKSDGTDVEALQLQSKDNLERVAVIQAFIAIRLLQLRADSREQENNRCEAVLPEICWKLLWVKQEKKPLPSTAPDLKWARITLAKLGGWYDSKRTGRPGWAALWRGWYKLAAIQEGYLMAQSFISGEI